MNTLSICSIAQDEEEVIKFFLECCVQTYIVLGDLLKEVIVIDGGSIDHTMDVLKSYSDKLPLTIIEHPFDTFGDQKNRAIDKSTGDFIFFPDTDMSWTINFASKFKSGFYKDTLYCDFPMLFTANDAYHFYDWPRGINMRLWRRGPRFLTKFHEKLDGQTQGIPCDGEVVIFENSRRQSDKALLSRGERYQKFVKEMTDEGGGPGPADKYYSNKHFEKFLEIPIEIKNLILPSTNGIIKE